MGYFNRYRSVEELKGQVLSRVENSGDQVVFETVNGDVYRMYHEQDCCESVYLEDVVGDLQDLVGSEILIAEESSGDTPADYKFEYEPESYTWTFYKFATRKGYVDMRWLGTSNGYYGESVNFVKDE
jgi:hypothetical protein